MDGSFELELTARGQSGDDGVVCRSPDLVTLVSTKAGEAWTVVVAPRASFAGTVVDEAGAPLAAAELAFRVRETLFREVGLHAFGVDEGNWSATSDALGRFELRGVAGGDNVFLSVRAAGFEEAEVPGDARVGPRPLDVGAEPLRARVRATSRRNRDVPRQDGGG